MTDQPTNKEGAADNADRVGELTAEQLAAAPGSAPGKGFARTPDVLTYGGPQMEDYGDWDSWYFARQKWVFERMKASSERRKAQNAGDQRSCGTENVR